MLALIAISIAPVWSGHPVGFDLLTQGNRQYVAFYDDQRQMTVAARKLGSNRWDFARLPSPVGWDSHNEVVMALDRGGYLHLSGNMHAVPLVYFRTTRPYDIHSFERVPAMLGRNEERCTYPRFLRTPAGDLVFTYRDGRSGNGSQIFNIYDERARAWRRLMDTPFTDGQGRMNAYFVGPVRGPDGFFHMVWTWRDTPDCATNHDLSYARSRDLVHWETSGGKPLPLPIRIENAEIVDPVPVDGGMINGNTRVGFDGNNRLTITYHKFDAQGNTQVFNARLEEGRWRIYQTSAWNYRWDFRGNGTIPFEIHLGSVNGWRLDFDHLREGSGTWQLDPATLKAVSTVKHEREKPLSNFPGMQVRYLEKDGFALRWETLGPNRDKPREGDVPPPSMLQLIDRRPNMEQYGALDTGRRTYRPLDKVAVTVTGRGKGDTRCGLRVADPEQRTYFETEIELKNNRGEAQFTAAGPLGTHYIYLTWPGEKRYSRYLNFRLDAETSIESGDADFDRLIQLYP